MPSDLSLCFFVFFLLLCVWWVFFFFRGPTILWCVCSLPLKTKRLLKGAQVYLVCVCVCVCVSFVKPILSVQGAKRTVAKQLSA